MSIFKKKKENKLDDYGFSDGSLDFDMPDLDGPKIKDDRKAASVKLLKSTAKGFGSQMATPSFIANLIKKSLPSGYGDAMDMADRTASSMKGIYSDAAKEVKPAINDLKKFTEKLMPSIEGGMPKSVAAKIKNWSKVESGYKDMSKEEQQNAALQMQMGEIFHMQTKMSLERGAKEDARSTLREAIDHGRHQDLFGQMDAMRVSLQQLAGYKIKIESNFQKKSLELQFRSYFLAQEQLTELKEHHVKAITNLEGILKNTGLPDFVKLNTVESVKQSMRTKFADTIGQSIIGQRADFLKKVMDNVGKAVKEKVSNVVSDFRSGIDMADQLRDAHEMNKEFGGDSLVGNMAGNMGADALGSWAAKNVGKIFKRDKDGNLPAIPSGFEYDENGKVIKHSFSKRIGNKVSGAARKLLGDERVNKVIEGGSKAGYMVNSLPQMAGQWAKNRDNYVSNNEEPTTFLGKLKKFVNESISPSGKLSDIGDVLADSIKDAKRQDTSLIGDSAGSMTSPAIFDRHVSKSITEIIPGYLSRIFHSLELSRSGSTKPINDGDLVKYDFNKNTFSVSKTLKDNIENTLKGVSVDDASKKSKVKQFQTKKLKKNTFESIEKLSPEAKETLLRKLKIDKKEYEEHKYAHSTIGKSNADVTMDEAYKLIDEITEQTNTKLSSQQREILAKKIISDNLNSETADFSRLGSTTSYGGAASEHASTYATMMKSYGDSSKFKDSHQKEFGDKFYNVGKSITDQRGYIQQLLNTGHRDELVSLGILSEGSDNINIEKLREYQVGKLTAKANGGLIHEPNPMLRGGDSVNKKLMPGSYVMPTDSTHRLGLANGGLVNTKLMHGEKVFSPNEAASIGVDKLDALKDATHEYADGGTVRSTKKLSAKSSQKELLYGIYETLQFTAHSLNSGTGNSGTGILDMTFRNAGKSIFNVGTKTASYLKNKFKQGSSKVYRLGKLGLFGTGGKPVAESIFTNATNPEIADLKKTWDVIVKNGEENTTDGLEIKARLDYLLKEELSKPRSGNATTGIFNSIKTGGLFGLIKHVGGKAIDDFRKIRDVYIPGEITPRLAAWKLKSGAYIDQATGKVITSYKDISGTVVDKLGNVILTSEEAKQAFLKETTGQKLLTLFTTIKNKATTGATTAFGKISQFGIGLATKAYALTKVPQDVYVKGKLDIPVLYARIMKLPGGYISAVDGHDIKNVGDIDGPVYGPIINGKRNTALTIEDFQTGICDSNGKELKVGMARFGRYLKDKMMGGFNKAKEAGKWAAGKAKDAFNWLGEKAKNGINLPGMSFGGISIMGGLGSSNILVKRLTQIRDLLNIGLPAKKKVDFTNSDKLDVTEQTNILKKGGAAIRDKFTLFKDKLTQSSSAHVNSIKEKLDELKITEQAKSLFSNIKDKFNKSKTGIGIGKRTDSLKNAFKQKKKDISPNQPLTKLTIEEMGKLPDYELEELNGLNNSELNDRFDPEHNKEQVKVGVKVLLKSKMSDFSKRASKLFGLKGKEIKPEEVTAEKTAENTSILKKLLTVMTPKTLRKGSYEDEVAANKLKTDEASKGEADNTKGKSGKGMFAGLASLFGKKKPDEEKKDDKGGIVDNLEQGAESYAGEKALGWGGKALKSGKGLLKFGGKALGIAGAAYGAYSAYDNLKQGNYGSAALDAGLSGVGLAATGIGGSVLSSLAAAFASPVVLPALAVAAAGAGLYFGYKFLTRKKLTDWNKIRYAQYGFLPTDEDHFKPVFELEDILKNAISYDKGVAKLEEKKIKVEDIVKIFDIDIKNADQFKALFNWFTNRFKPVYLTHLTALHAISEDADLDGIDKLKPSEQKQYLDVAKFSDGPYSYTGSPFPKLDKLPADSSVVNNLTSDMDSKIQDAIKKSPDNKVGSSTVNVGLVTANAAARKDDIIATQTGAKLDKSGKSISTKESTSSKWWETTKSVGKWSAITLGSVLGIGSLLGLATGSGVVAGASTALSVSGITGAIGLAGTLGAGAASIIGGLATVLASPVVLAPAIVGLLGYATYKYLKDYHLNTISKIRYAQYGFMDKDTDHLNPVFSLEKLLLDCVYYSSGIANLDFDKVKKKLSDIYDLFNVSVDNKDQLGKFTVWFDKRFKPVYMAHLSALNKVAPNKDINNVDMLKPSDQKTYLDIVKCIDGIYDITVTPFLNQNELVANKGAVDGYIKLAMSDLDSTLKTKGNIEQTYLGSFLDKVDNLKKIASNIASNTVDVSKNTASKGASFLGDTGKTIGSAFAGKTGGDVGQKVGAGIGAAGGAIIGAAGGAIASVAGALTSGSGGSINDVPMPTGDGTWSALKDTITTAANMVGVNPDLMATISAIESGFKSTVKAATSSATGLNQFITSTWDTMVDKFGSKYGIPKGTPPTDPRANALLGAEFTKGNLEALKGVVDRPLTATDAYLAHFLGAGGAKQLLKASPDAIAANIMPAAARANKSIFYDSNGSPKTVSGVYAEIDRRVKSKGAQFGIGNYVQSNANASIQPNTLLPVHAANPSIKTATTVAGANTNKPTQSLANGGLVGDPAMDAFSAGFSRMSNSSKGIMAQQDYSKRTMERNIGKIGSILTSSLEVQQKQYDTLNKILAAVSGKALNNAKADVKSVQQVLDNPNNKKPVEMPEAPLSMRKMSIAT